MLFHWHTNVVPQTHEFAHQIDGKRLFNCHCWNPLRIKQQTIKRFCKSTVEDKSWPGDMPNYIHIEVGSYQDKIINI